MAKESSTRTTRLSGQLDDRYEDYRDNRDMTDAEALRSLIRSGLDDQAPTSSGIGASVFGLAQRELVLQVKLLGWFLTFAAVTLGAYSFGVVGGAAWIVPAAFFLLMAASTAIGTLAGLWSAIDPTPNTAAAESDEVEA